MTQLHLYLKRSRVKELALQALRPGSVLIDLETCNIIERPRPEKGFARFSKACWYRIRSQAWLTAVRKAVGEYKQLTRAQEQHLADFERPYAERRAELERQRAALDMQRAALDRHYDKDRQELIDALRFDSSRDLARIRELLDQAVRLTEEEGAPTLEAAAVWADPDPMLYENRPHEEDPDEIPF